jgi:PIN domain nuclease of toxin-antitoxin system
MTLKNICNEFTARYSYFSLFSEDNPKLSKNAKALIEDVDNNCLISIASLWEIAIKVSLSKLKIKIEFNNLIDEINKQNFTVLPVSFEHIAELLNLEFHHRDPFDRLLAAQSVTEDLTLISSDDIFDKYKVKRVW